MADAEAVQTGVRPDEILITELTLRSTDVYLPTSPLEVNGKPFTVGFDETRMTAAVNAVAEYDLGLGLHPRQVTIGLVPGIADVKLGHDLQPVIERQKEVKQIPLLSRLDTGGTVISLSLPGEVRSSEYSDEGLLEILKHQVNKDLLVALSQNIQAKKKFTAAWRISGLALSTSIGEGVGIGLSNNWKAMIEAGTIDALAGGAVFIGGWGVYTKFRWGLGERSLPSRAVKSSRNYQKINWLLEKTSKEGPIISLEPTQTEDPA